MYYDIKVKDLIYNKMRENISFSFLLHSVYISKRVTYRVINSIDELILEIALTQIKSYLQKKLKYTVDLSLINWKNKTKCLD